MKEKEPENPHYRIAEFAKMVGIDPSTIRYYEKQGLSGMRRDENGYRVFDQYDAFQMNTFRAIYARGFSISESLKMMEYPSRKEIILGLRKNCKDMERELLLLAARKRWAEETLRLLELQEAGGPMLWRMELPDYYYLPASRQKDFTITQENGEIRNAWADWLGVTRFAGVADGKAFCRGENAPIDLGEAVSVPDFEAYGYPKDQTVQRLTMGDCLCFYSPQRSGPDFLLSDYPQVTAYLEEHGLTAAGDILYFCLMLYIEDEGKNHGVVALPIRKKK